MLFLSDRESPRKFAVSQLDYLLGLAFKGGDAMRLQFDREEAKPLDTRGFSYRYWDARASFEVGGDGEKGASAGGSRPVKPSLLDTLRGSITVGWLLHNRSYYARSDLTGLACLRYNARGELPLMDAVVLKGEADFLTEKRRAWEPVQLGLSAGVGIKSQGVELALLSESAKMLDRTGYARYYLLTLTVPFNRR
jgi:hypothetical protein